MAVEKRWERDDILEMEIWHAGRNAEDQLEVSKAALEKIAVPANEILEAYESEAERLLRELPNGHPQKRLMRSIISDVHLARQAFVDKDLEMFGKRVYWLGLDAMRARKLWVHLDGDRTEFDDYDVYRDNDQCLASLGIPYTLVSPAVWKRTAEIRGKGKEVACTRALQLFPELADRLAARLLRDHDGLGLEEGGRRGGRAHASRGDLRPRPSRSRQR